MQIALYLESCTPNLCAGRAESGLVVACSNLSMYLYSDSGCHSALDEDIATTFCILRAEGTTAAACWTIGPRMPEPLGLRRSRGSGPPRFRHGCAACAEPPRAPPVLLAASARLPRIVATATFARPGHGESSEVRTPTRRVATNSVWVLALNNLVLPGPSDSHMGDAR